MSWEWFKTVIISPIAINKTDLKRAWDNKWKKERKERPKEKDIKIKPRWLKVESAIIFFRSFSKREDRPA